ncbi:hypothetical protein ACDH63_15185 [Xanthomonas axonopodis pv. maculifoliigardeniae]|uniref:hypothetical protein n=1 Tax=Xanthomonas axonopodis TaxID=53413 RepID=UPI0035576D73
MEEAAEETGAHPALDGNDYQVCLAMLFFEFWSWRWTRVRSMFSSELTARNRSARRACTPAGFDAWLIWAEVAAGGDARARAGAPTPEK